MIHFISEWKIMVFPLRVLYNLANSCHSGKFNLTVIFFNFGIFSYYYISIAIEKSFSNIDILNLLIVLQRLWGLGVTCTFDKISPLNFLWDLGINVLFWQIVFTFYIYMFYLSFSLHIFIYLVDLAVSHAADFKKAN